MAKKTSKLKMQAIISISQSIHSNIKCSISSKYKFIISQYNIGLKARLIRFNFI